MIVVKHRALSVTISVPIIRPAIELQVSCNKGSGHLAITPDPGSGVTAIGRRHHLKQLGMNVTLLWPPSPTNLRAAKDTTLDFTGRFYAELCYFHTMVEADIEAPFGIPNAVLSWYHSPELRSILHTWINNQKFILASTSAVSTLIQKVFQLI